MRRSLNRIALEVLERNRGLSDLAVVGIQRRGVPLADRLASELGQMEDVTVPVASLDINLYRDDLQERAQPLARPTQMPFPVDGKKIVLVDAVLFTGRTIRTAMDALMDFGRPKQVQLAVLVDRGHQELPIRADYVGRTVSTEWDDVVKVRAHGGRQHRRGGCEQTGSGSSDFHRRRQQRGRQWPQLLEPHDPNTPPPPPAPPTSPSSTQS